MSLRLLFFCIITGTLSISLNAQDLAWAKVYDRLAHQRDIATGFNQCVVNCGRFGVDSVDVDPSTSSFWIYKQNTLSNGTPYLSKFDSTGNLLWAYSYLSYGAALLNSVAVDNQNNIIVTGVYTDSIDADILSTTYMLRSNVPSRKGLFVAKYSANGVLIWAKKVEGDVEPIKVRTDNMNNVVIVGRFRDTADFNPGAGVSQKVSTQFGVSFSWNTFLLKLNSNGIFSWVNHWESADLSRQKMDIDLNNNIFMVCNFSDTVDIDPSPPTTNIISQGGWDVTSLKMNSSGQLLLHREIHNLGSITLESFTIEPSGNCYYAIKGGASPIDIDPGPGVTPISTNAQNNEILFKWDNNGVLQWGFLTNLTGYGHHVKIQANNSGGVYIVSTDNPGNVSFIDIDPSAGVDTVNTYTLCDIIVRSISPNGTYLWGGLMGGVGQFDHFVNVCGDDVSSLYIFGFSAGNFDFDPNSGVVLHAGGNSYVIKIRNCHVASGLNFQSCDSVVYNGQVYYSDTILKSIYTLPNNCDSIFSVNINIAPIADDTIVVDTCKYYVWNNVMYTNSGFYTNTYNAAGCDSVVTLDLTLHQGSVHNVSIAGCPSATFNGITYNQPGQYQQQYSNINGCDSNYLITVIQNTVDTSITMSGTTSLVANATPATYQWIDCSTMLPIAGATSALFVPSVPGSYACIVTQNSCTDTSGCYSIVITPDVVNDFSIVTGLYPNPSEGSYTLELDRTYQNVQLEVRTINGQLVWKRSFDKLKETNLIIEKSSGVYMLYIKQEGRVQVKKLLKW